MRTLTITVQDSGDFFKEAQAAGHRIDAGSGYQGETYSFPSLPLLFQVFTPRRWELLQKLQAVGPVSLRSLARALGRDDYRNLVVFSSLSKRSNVPGLRSGFVAGDARVLEKFTLYRTYHGCAMNPAV